MKVQELINKFSKILKQVIVKFYKKRSKQAGRKLRAPLNYYVKSILFVITQGVSWRSLDLLPTKGKVKGDTIRKRFIFWMENRIFSTTYNIFLNKYTSKYATLFKNFIIDSTVIPNICGGEDITDFHPKVPKKRSSKYTILVDERGIPVSSFFDKSKHHDVSHIEPVIKNLPEGIKNKGTYNQPITISGDKGYIISKNKNKTLRKEHKVTINYIPRNNMKKQPSKENKNKMKNRIKVENTFSRLKHTFKRLSNLKDRKPEIFNTWIMIASTMLIFEKVQ